MTLATPARPKKEPSSMANTTPQAPTLSMATGPVFYQWSPTQLIEAALALEEGVFSHTGALVVTTGQYTGRSPNDRFFVDTPGIHNTIDWGTTNRPMDEGVFNAIEERFKTYLTNQPVYVMDGYGGADPNYAMAVRVINTRASQNLFMHQMLVRPTPEQLSTFNPELTIVCCPELKLNGESDGVRSEAGILVHLERRLILIAGTSYSGEMKKSVFTTLNYLLPERDVFPMHCSANVDPKTQRSALFFGLSGTGKTTLSADSSRTLIGDDEHGWGPNGIYNFEGGCYAKTIRLNPAHEPEIYHAIRFGSLVENVVIDSQTRIPNYDDASLTENGRVAYPIDFIPNASLTGVAGHPSTVIFLTADAFGVMPPIAKLTPEQAQYHFMSGYTSKLAGTERGITEPKAAFSTCFGGPFMPRPAMVYAMLLKKRLQEHPASIYLINTGWQGGAYGKGGKRMSIPYTRAMVNAALSGELDTVPYETLPILNLSIPTQCPGVPSEVLNPRKQWADTAAYDAAAKHLATLFVENFKQFTGTNDLAGVGPQP
ncbi:MAG: phosphoenolpyruvate carboxykinase (ATP) [Vampirovibrionales bacterium]